MDQGRIDAQEIYTEYLMKETLPGACRDIYFTDVNATNKLKTGSGVSTIRATDDTEYILRDNVSNLTREKYSAKTPASIKKSTPSRAPVNVLRPPQGVYELAGANVRGIYDLSGEPLVHSGQDIHHHQSKSNCFTLTWRRILIVGAFVTLVGGAIIVTVNLTLNGSGKYN